MAHTGQTDRTSAGRICPTDYRLGANAFLQQPVHKTKVLYLAGGLYGNPLALTAIEQLLDAERTSQKVLCLNGDFHWFDARADIFAEIDERTACHWRTRGNVETEISRGGNTDAGCGCAYPESVDDADVDRSNQIMRVLACSAAEALDSHAMNMLGRLPAVARFQVGRSRIGVTHGDDGSMAGWSFAHDHIEQTWIDGLGERMDWMDMSGIASSHTCLPVSSLSPDQRHFVVNNGSAGMANFAGTSFGVVTRIAPVHLHAPIDPLYEHQFDGLRVSALPVVFDLGEWLTMFDAMWPANSPAAVSYRDRICHGPDYQLAQATQHDVGSTTLRDAA